MVLLRWELIVSKAISLNFNYNIYYDVLLIFRFFPHLQTITTSSINGDFIYIIFVIIFPIYIPFIKVGLPSKFGHFINGDFVEPVEGKYFDNVSPINGETFIQSARGSKADIDNAVSAANVAFDTTWSKVSVTERSNMLLKIADIIENNLDRLAKIETVDNGKAVRETMAADLPLVVDHFRYFAGVIRAEEGSASEIDGDTLSLCIQEPLGVRFNLFQYTLNTFS